MDKKSYENYNELKYESGYWGLDRSKNKWFSKYVKYKILDNWINPIKNKGYLLDAGGGVGNYAFLFKDKFKKTAVLEISNKALQLIPDKDIIKIHSSIIDPKIKNNSVDCILLVDVFEHIKEEDLEKMMKNLNKVLKKDGRILIFTSQYGYGWGLIWKRIMRDKNRLANGEERGGHLNRLKFSEMKNLFRNAGLEVEDYYHYSIIFQQITDSLKDNFAKLALLFRKKQSIDSVRPGQSIKEGLRHIEENLWIYIPLKVLSYISYLDIILFGKLLPGTSIFLRLKKR